MADIIKHIAFIMDGNGRWALKRGLPRSAGHKKGAENVAKIAEAVMNAGVKYVTFYAFSTENWKRPAEEVDTLMNLLRQYLDGDLKKLSEKGVCLKFIGEKEMLAPDIVQKITALEAQTSKNDKLVMQIALSYGSRAEIISAVKKIAEKIKNGDMFLKQIDENAFSGMLYTANVPDPDILIRTSGEQRISNYLLWQIAYTELFFTQTPWPDFSKDELFEMIEKYKTRERRYGKV